MSSHRFGRVEIRPGQRQLLIDGRPAALGARAFDVLHALVERRDRIVGKNELLDLVWPGLVVEENNLQVQVSALRKLLGTDAIVTVPGRGYRFTLGAETPDRGPSDGSVAGARAATAPGAAGNVPLLVEPPIGRDAEIAALRELVTRHRLVSIIGAGGIGKTTVGLSLADAVRRDFADGVWWVELAQLSDGNLVGGTVARAIGIHIAPDGPAGEGLAAALGEASTLIVLDNCEHLAEPVSALVGAVLVRVPNARFVLTSQEPLRVPHEHVFRLEPLGAPAAEAALTPLLAADFPAVRLLVERARAGDRRFELTASNVDAVAEICRRLDGIPLAIELAAARLPLMGADGLRRRLDERFRVLTAGGRSVLRRHQTLRATLEWSHALLSADEQVVFRRLGVAAGGASLALAQAVAADDTLDPWRVLTALGSLVDRSLVVADGGNAPRYRLLETTRAYALEQLATAGETAAWMRRHAQAVLAALVERSERVWYGERDEEIGAELENVRAAIDWALGGDGDAELAVELVAHSLGVWWSTAATDEGLVRAASAVVHLDPAAPIAPRFWLTYATLGVFSARTDCFEAAQRAAQHARACGDAPSLFHALVVRAGIAARRYEFTAAHEAIAEACQVERDAWPAKTRAWRAFAEWIVALREGRYADARAHALRQADLYRASGDARGEQIALGNVAACDLYAGQPDAAAAQLRAVVAELGRLGAESAASHSVFNLAAALLALGDVPAALNEAVRAHALLRREGDQALMLPLLAQLAAARGDPHAAVQVAGYTLDYWKRLGIRPRTPLVPEQLAPDLDAAERDGLLADGAHLTEEQAFGLVLLNGWTRPG